MFEVVKGLHKDPKAKCVWIDRRSILGNPFHLLDKNNFDERQKSIQKYRVWLWERIKERAAVYKSLMQLLEMERKYKTVYLMCHCKPLACHGDVIVKALEWMKTK